MTEMKRDTTEGVAEKERNGDLVFCFTIDSEFNWFCKVISGHVGEFEVLFLVEVLDFWRLHTC